MKAIQLLKEPYPFPENSRRTLRKILIVSLFVSLFLLVFEPFGLSQWGNPNKRWYILGYGVVTLIFFLFENYVWRLLFPFWYREGKWTVSREIFAQLVLIFFIAVGNVWYSHLIGVIHLSVRSFFVFLTWTLSVGLFPAVMGTTFTYIKISKLHTNQAAEILPAEEHPIMATAASIELVAENEKDKIHVPVHALRYIESADNYATVVWESEGKLEKELLRSSLSRLENMIQDPYVVRVHRSFIANLHRVKSVSGNAQGYRLHLDVAEVPVSRKYGPQTLALLKKLVG